jgi:hypothetical protein
MLDPELLWVLSTSLLLFMLLLVPLIKFQIGGKGSFELVRYWVLERREIDSMTYWYTIRASVGTVAHERVRRAKRARFQNYFSILN